MVLYMSSRYIVRHIVIYYCNILMVSYACDEKCANSTNDSMKYISTKTEYLP